MSLRGRGYRPEIDGLRALAVVPVVLFHAGVDAFSGGFVEVDIFFVISGYLICRIILSEAEEDRFSFIKFYDRRIRRIVPALLLVILVSIALSLLFALPNQVMDVGKSAIAALLSFSNFYFWAQGGYFAPAAEFRPLLHTWSLGVEEQFYIFFPVFVILFLKIKLNVRLIILYSLLPMYAISLWLSFEKPSVAFFLLPARAWELGLGALLASGAIPAIGSRLLREVFSAAGFGMIILSVFVIDLGMVFPGWVALLPCIGSALIIHTANGGTLVQRLLSVRHIVFVGLISYSLYLWHWPIFVFMRMIPGGAASVHIAVDCRRRDIHDLAAIDLEVR